MMDKELELIRDQQKDSWNKFSSGWKKWDELTMDFLKPMGDKIISLLDLKENDIVLDVASGTGEPGLTIASRLKKGKVVGVDISQDMLEIAKENADARGIRNFEILACDVCNLPFEDNTFDAISCRFGFMFFPDMQLAAKEMTRVLKPGGKIATSVWNVAEKNFWVTAIMGTIKRNMELPVPPDGAPGMFRCAKDGLIVELFSNAGLRNVSQREVSSQMNSKTTEVYWAMMNDIGAPIVAALSKADDALREKIKKEVFQEVSQRFPDGNVIFDTSALIIYGEK